MVGGAGSGPWWISLHKHAMHHWSPCQEEKQAGGKNCNATQTVKLLLLGDIRFSQEISCRRYHASPSELLLAILLISVAFQLRAHTLHIKVIRLLSAPAAARSAIHSQPYDCNMGALIPPDPTEPCTLTCTFDLTQPEVQHTILKLKTLLGRLAQHRRQQQQQAQPAADALAAQLGGRLVIGGGESSRQRSPVPHAITLQFRCRQCRTVRPADRARTLISH